jgi:hypothetical protein
VGEDVDFFDLEGVANPRFVSAFRLFKPPLRDPDALAQILDRRCSHFLSFRDSAEVKTYAAMRRRVRDRFKKMRKLAADLLNEGSEFSDVYAYSQAIEDVFPDHVAFEQRQLLRRKLIAAVSLLSEIPLRENLRAFEGRPNLNKNTAEAVRAVYEYWTEVEGREFTASAGREHGHPGLEANKGTMAELTNKVLTVLGLRCTGSELETHLRKVHEDRSQ